MHPTLAENLKKLQFPKKKLLNVPKGPEIKRPKKPVDKATLKKTIRTRMQWWNSLSLKEQKHYLEEHPKSKLPLKKSTGPLDLKKDKNDKKASKNSKEDKKSQTDTSKSDKKKNKIKPKLLTKNPKTTKLFKVDDEAVNSVPHAEQQKINAEIEQAMMGGAPEDEHEASDENDENAPDEDDEEEQEYIRQHRAAKKAKEDRGTKHDKQDREYKARNEERRETPEDEEGGDPELEDKIDKQLHPEQKEAFIKAAEDLADENSSEKKRARAARRLKQLNALIFLTKIAGAATSAALIYHFGSAPGAQCATFFALHHAQHDLQNSTTKAYLAKWAHKKFTGEDMDDDKFNGLLGIGNRVKEVGKHHSSGGGHHHHKKH